MQLGTFIQLDYVQLRLTVTCTSSSKLPAPASWASMGWCKCSQCASLPSSTQPDLAFLPLFFPALYGAHNTAGIRTYIHTRHTVNNPVPEPVSFKPEYKRFFGKLKGCKLALRVPPVGTIGGTTAG